MAQTAARKPEAKKPEPKRAEAKKPEPKNGEGKKAQAKAPETKEPWRGFKLGLWQRDINVRWFIQQN